MEKLIVVGRFPHSTRKAEGMVQRIAAIDKQIATYPRLYLDLYGFKNFKSRVKKFGKVSVFSASFTRFYKILQFLRSAKYVYIHSIYFFALIIIPVLFLNSRVHLILDVHGTVPEEIEYSGNSVLAKIMSWVERYAFHRVNIVICVTRRMVNYYSSKYPSAGVSYKYLPIFTDTVCQAADPESVNTLKRNLKIPDGSVVFLYSGGLQKWQNIDKMLDEVKRIYPFESYWFIFCTNEEDILRQRIISLFGYIPSRIIITHVAPDNLKNFYALADFGFILRDDHILNRVANPTKLVEYLYFGVRPILLSQEIGDFLEMGFEFRLLGDPDDYHSNSRKSLINKKIALTLEEDSRTANLAALIRTD